MIHFIDTFRLRGILCLHLMHIVAGMNCHKTTTTKSLCVVLVKTRGLESEVEILVRPNHRLAAIIYTSRFVFYFSNLLRTYSHFFVVLVVFVFVFVIDGVGVDFFFIARFTLFIYLTRKSLVIQYPDALG